MKRVVWKPGSVEVQCIGGSQPQTFNARRAVVALPLGVLQSGHVKFSPMPKHIQTAMSRIRMGHVRRMVLLFQQRFWAQLKDLYGTEAFRELSFAFALPGPFPTWWTQFPQLSPSLAAWAGGSAADALAEHSQDELEQAALGTLSKMFRIDAAQVRNLLDRAESHDWQRDPFSLGSYSYLAVDGLNAAEQLATPVESTLFFAGEHTDTAGNWGTVHAAIESGTRAAHQVLSFFWASPSNSTSASI